MNRHQLEILCVVAAHQSFSKAAAELYLTQSPVSMGAVPLDCRYLQLLSFRYSAMISKGIDIV